MSARRGPCPSCGASPEKAVIDSAAGVMLCTGCGLVLEPMLLADSLEAVETECRTVAPIRAIHSLPANSSESIAGNALAPASSAALGESPTHTTTDLRQGKLDIRHHAKESRRIRDYISGVATALQLAGLVDRCHYLFDAISLQPRVRLGRNGELIAAVCLVAAAREQRRVVTIKQMASAVGTSTRELGKVMRQYHPQLPLATPLVDGTSLVDTIVNRVYHGYREARTALASPSSPALPILDNNIFHTAHQRAVTETAGQLQAFATESCLGAGCNPLGRCAATVFLAITAHAYDHKIDPAKEDPIVAEETDAAMLSLDPGPLRPDDDGDSVGFNWNGEDDVGRIVTWIMARIIPEMGVSLRSVRARYDELRRAVLCHAAYLPWAPATLSNDVRRYARDVAQYHKELVPRVRTAPATNQQPMAYLDADPPLNPKRRRKTEATVSANTARVGSKPPTLDTSSSSSHDSFTRKPAKLRDMTTTATDFAHQDRRQPTDNIAAHLLQQVDPNLPLVDRVAMVRLYLAGVPWATSRSFSSDRLAWLMKRYSHHVPPCPTGADQFMYSPGRDLQAPDPEFQVRDLLEGCPFCGEWHGFRKRRLVVAAQAGGSAESRQPPVSDREIDLYLI
ncbi:hypothetical protein IWQ60_009956 [Tieghemiomyces parasiticus]|uniref:TFIIB-type domain-containing protein n=1 Tax=Tieghemiomyces parasiticus TaxID=78921 RepID=A0A9W8DNH5_9FUNG|nr:hypothetical protein IWQ60_009956 [Tieghemiomyces parasiticus]